MTEQTYVQQSPLPVIVPHYDSETKFPICTMCKMEAKRGDYTYTADRTHIVCRWCLPKFQRPQPVIAPTYHPYESHAPVSRYLYYNAQGQLVSKYISDNPSVISYKDQN
jgi:hypothetical protein